MVHIFNKHRESVSNAYPSVFTKDDVIALISSIEQHVLDYTPNNEKIIEAIKEEVLTIVENFDYESDIDLELYDKEITTSFETRGLVRRIELAFDEKGGV